MARGAVRAAFRAAQPVAALGADRLSVRAPRLDRGVRGVGTDGHARRRAARRRHLGGVLLGSLLDRHLARDDAAAGEHADERHLGHRRRAEREAARRRAAHGGAPGEARGAQHARLEAEARHDRQRHGEQLALPPDLVAVGAAARAAAQVMAKLVAAKRAAAQGGELLANLRTRSLACVAALDEGCPRSEHETLHAPRLAAEHLGDLGVREPGRLGEEQRSALLLGQLAHVGEELAQLGALLHLLAEPVGRELVELRRVLAARAQHGHAAIASDRVEPRLERDLPPSAPLKILVCGREGVLHGVLCLLAGAEHVAAEG